MKINYKIICDREDVDFQYLSDALNWVNKNKIKVLCISEWQYGYTLFYFEKKKQNESNKTNS